MSPNSHRTSRNSNSVACIAQQPPMSNYPQPSTYQYPGFHKTSSIPNSHSPIPPRSLKTPTQVPPGQNVPLSYNLPQMGMLPPQQQQQQQQQGSPLYDGNSTTPPVKPPTDQEIYLTTNRQMKPDQQYDSMAKAMNSFHTTTIRPVSYTHLDVYKRQTFRLLLTTFIFSKFPYKSISIRLSSSSGSN